MQIVKHFKYHSRWRLGEWLTVGSWSSPRAQAFA